MNQEMINDLNEIGYPSELWTIVSPEVVKEAEAFSGHQNNLYGIFNRKVAKKYPKGSKTAKIEWLEKNQISFGEKTETIEIEATHIVETEQGIKKVKEGETYTPKVNPDIEAIGNAKSIEDLKEIAKGNPNMKIIGDTPTEKIEKIVADSGIPKDNVIIAKVPPVKEIPADVAVEVEAVQKEENEICRECHKNPKFEPSVVLQESLDGTICAKCAGVLWETRVAKFVEQGYSHMAGDTILDDGHGNRVDSASWGIMETQEFNNKLNRAKVRLSIRNKDAEKAVDKVIEEGTTTNIESKEKEELAISDKLRNQRIADMESIGMEYNSDDNNFRNNKFSIVLDNASELFNYDDKSWKNSLELAESLIGESKSKVKERGVTITNVDKEKVIGHFGVVDELMETLTAFKQVFYAITVVKEALDSDLTPAKKIAKIKSVTKNIKVN